MANCANMCNGILKNPNPWLMLYPWWDMSNASPHLRLEEATLEDWQYVKFQASLIWTCIDCNSSQSLDLASAANKASSLYLWTWTEGNGTSTSFRDTALWRKWTQHSSVFFRTSVPVGSETDELVTDAGILCWTMEIYSWVEHVWAISYHFIIFYAELPG